MKYEKSSPVTGRRGPEGSERFRLPDFQDTWRRRW